MNNAWKPLNGFEAVNAAEEADMEIEVNIFDEWKPWNWEFGGCWSKFGLKT